jgi:Immunity protein 8
MAMRAQLKWLHSPDVPDLKNFKPDGPFSILLQAMAGPVEAPGEESFDIVVCTYDWLQANPPARITPGRHYLFVAEFDYNELFDYLRNYCSDCEGGTWDEVALKVGRIGRWEFEDYKPSVE